MITSMSAAARSGLSARFLAAGLTAMAVATLFVAALQPASAQDLKISLNAPYDGSNAAFFLAEDKGYYAAQGLKVSFDPSAGSGEAVTRVASGTYDFGFGDINVLMEFNAKNPTTPPRRSTCSLPLAALGRQFAKTGIGKPADLAGKDRRRADRQRLQAVRPTPSSPT